MAGAEGKAGTTQEYFIKQSNRAIEIERIGDKEQYTVGKDGFVDIDYVEGTAFLDAKGRRRGGVTFQANGRGRVGWLLGGDVFVTEGAKAACGVLGVREVKGVQEVEGVKVEGRPVFRLPKLWVTEQGSATVNDLAHGVVRVEDRACLVINNIPQNFGEGDLGSKDKLVLQGGATFIGKGALRQNLAGHSLTISGENTAVFVSDQETAQRLGNRPEIQNSVFLLPTDKLRLTHEYRLNISVSKDGSVAEEKILVWTKVQNQAGKTAYAVYEIDKNNRLHPFFGIQDNTADVSQFRQGLVEKILYNRAGVELRINGKVVTRTAAPAVAEAAPVVAEPVAEPAEAVVPVTPEAAAAGGLAPELRQRLEQAEIEGITTPEEAINRLIELQEKFKARGERLGLLAGKVSELGKQVKRLETEIRQLQETQGAGVPAEVQAKAEILDRLNQAAQDLELDRATDFPRAIQDLRRTVLDAEKVKGWEIIARLEQGDKLVAQAIREGRWDDMSTDIREALEEVGLIEKKVKVAEKFYSEEDLAKELGQQPHVIKAWVKRLHGILGSEATGGRDLSEEEAALLREIKQCRVDEEMSDWTEIERRLRAMQKERGQTAEEVEVEKVVKTPRVRREPREKKATVEPKQASGNIDWYAAQDILGSATRVERAQVILGDELSENARKRVKTGKAAEETVEPAFNIRDIWLMRRADQLVTPTTSEADYQSIRYHATEDNEFLNVILERLEKETDRTRRQWGLNQVAQAMEIKTKDLKKFIEEQNIPIPKGPRNQWLIDIPTFSEIYLQWLGRKTRETNRAPKKVETPRTEAAPPEFTGLAE